MMVHAVPQEQRAYPREGVAGVRREPDGSGGKGRGIVVCQGRTACDETASTQGPWLGRCVSSGTIAPHPVCLLTRPCSAISLSSLSLYAGGHAHPLSSTTFPAHIR